MAATSSMHLFGSLFASMIVLLVILPTGHTLTCYETNDEGEVKEISNSSWTYCVLVPASGESKGKVFGVGEKNDNTATYDSTFGMGSEDGAFKILSLCVLEKYDFGMFSPRFKVPPEFLFRCVCNYDRCNAATTFGAYLNNIRTDNM